jgi:hypothetical protein
LPEHSKVDWEAEKRRKYQIDDRLSIACHVMPWHNNLQFNELRKFCLHVAVSASSLHHQQALNTGLSTGQALIEPEPNIAAWQQRTQP